MRFLIAPPAQSISQSGLCPRYTCGTCYALPHLSHLHGLRSDGPSLQVQGTPGSRQLVIGAHKLPSSLHSIKRCQQRIIWGCGPHLLVIYCVHPLFWPLPPTLTHRRLLLGKAGP